MDDRSHLHDGEVLLCSLRASVAGLFSGLMRGVTEGLFFGVILGMAGAVAALAMGWSSALWIGVALLVLGLVLVVAQRIRLWRHTYFRITTERILIPESGSLFHPPLHTVKWPQYQESHVGHRGSFDLVVPRSRPIFIRYGTADAHKEVKFPSLPFAEDIKHYLDKVDSAVRRGETASLKPFVAKAKGNRD